MDTKLDHDPLHRDGHGDILPLTPNLSRVLLGVMLRQEYPFEDAQNLAVLGDHIITSIETLTPRIQHLTRAELHIHIDAQTMEPNFTATVHGMDRDGSAGVELRHLAHLLVQSDFVVTANDQDMLRNLYAVAYRALIAAQSTEFRADAEKSFDDALELADAALAPGADAVLCGGSTAN